MGDDVSSTSDINLDTEPNMKAADFRVFNKLAEQMSYYHDSIRLSWNALHAATEPTVYKPSAIQLIKSGQQFCQHLEAHHNIEERVWFPILVRKMQGFQANGFAKAQHKDMHQGLDIMVAYLDDCRAGRKDFVRVDLRSIMDSFGGVLWQHLDEEVEELGATNMKEYWTLTEMREMPI